MTLTMAGKNEEGEIEFIGTKQEWQGKKVVKTFLTLEYTGGEKEEFFSDEHQGDPIENTIDYLKAIEEKNGT